MNNISSYFFLDDERDPYKTTHVVLPTAHWHIMRNYDEFVASVELFYNQYNALPDFISFDHDLAAEHYRKSMYNPDEHYNSYYTDGTFKEKTGHEAAKWLVEFCMNKDLDIPEYMVHSMNPIGAKNITSILESYIKHRTNNNNKRNKINTPKTHEEAQQAHRDGLTVEYSHINALGFVIWWSPITSVDDIVDTKWHITRLRIRGGET